MMTPIYTEHLNPGFHKGTLLKDPHQLLQGTGNLIRQIPVKKPGDYRYPRVKDLVKAAAEFATNDLDKPTKVTDRTISKIK